MNKVIVDCSVGQTSVLPLSDADLAQQQTDQNAGAQATQLAQQIQTNSAAIQTKLLAALNNNINWLQANPTGATLTAPQTRVLIQEINGLIRFVIGLLADVNQLTSTSGT